MKREEANRILNHLEIIRGIAEGKTIQWALKPAGDEDTKLVWYDYAHTEAWNPYALANTLIRVKPEPVVKTSYIPVYYDKRGQTSVGAERASLYSVRKFNGSASYAIEMTFTDGVPSVDIIKLVG
jgi:hypothetical protein